MVRLNNPDVRASDIYRKHLIEQTMRLLLTFCLLFLVGLETRASEPKPIAVGVGEEFEIVLESPRGADRQWLLAKPLDESLLKQSGREYRNRPASNAQLRTCEVLRYKALAKGKTEVHLKFASLFVRDQNPAATTNFVVVITKPSAKTGK